MTNNYLKRLVREALRKMIQEDSAMQRMLHTRGYFGSVMNASGGWVNLGEVAEKWLGEK